MGGTNHMNKEQWTWTRFEQTNQGVQVGAEMKTRLSSE